MTADSIGKIPVVIAEIDQPQCSLTYGIGDCGAAIGVTGADKCFNARATCQFISAYNENDIVTIRFAISHGDLPTDIYLIPSMKSASTSPTRINVGGRTGTDSPLGRRAEINITLDDHPHSDLLVDKYVDERNYNPLERSTFWAKWLKRNPYHVNIPLRLKEGFAGQSLEEMQTRHYIIEKIEGPDSSGKVKIRGTDILRLADDDKSMWPQLSTGRLLSGITDTSSALTVTGAAITEYQQYNTDKIRISDEVIGYTGLATSLDGNLEFTGLTRGIDGTEAGSHSAEDTVQACVEYTLEPPWEVVRDLLQDAAGVPTDFIHYDEWTTEAERWLGGMTVSRLITEPTGVNDMLGQLCEQCSFYIWWDELSREIKFRAIHPPDEDVALITEGNHLIQNKTSVKVRPELRASEVWVSFLPRDYTLDLSKRESYGQTVARLSDNPYGERRVYEILSPWLDTRAQVDLLTFRMLTRYRDPPKYLNFSLHIKDRYLKVGDPFDVEYKGFVDEFGNTERVRYQVISSHENLHSEQIKIEAQRFDYSIDFRASFWMVEEAPNYADASDIEKTTGCFWADEDGRLPNGDPGYVWS